MEGIEQNKGEIKLLISVKGTSPLLMNRFAEKSIDSKIKRRAGAIADEDIKNKLYIYNDKTHIPAVYFRNSIVEASKQFKIAGKGKSTYSKLVGATVDVLPEMISLTEKYVPFKIAAVNPMTKGRMMVTRPRFDKWSAEFEVILHDPSVPATVFHDILENAGKYVGIGDWRPEKKGMFGKFMITSFKEVDNS